MPSLASLIALNPYHRANSLPELLSWLDVDFVRCAYVTVLGRQPDVDGEAFYTDMLRRGASKLEVLWQLRRSTEGREHDPGIAGFDKALRRYRNANWPLLGAIVRAITGREGNSPAERRFRALDNQLAVARLDQEREFSFLQRQAEMQSASLEKVATESRSIAEAVKGIADIERHLNAHSAELTAIRSENQATSVIQLGINAMRSEQQDFSGRLSGVLALLKTDLRTHHSALQLGIDLVRGEAVRREDLASLKDASSSLLNPLQLVLESIKADAARSDHLASLDERAETRFVSLVKASEEVSAQTRAMEQSILAKVEKIASGSLGQSRLDVFELHIGNLINAQVELQSALRARLDDALSLLRSAVRLEDIVVVRDRLDAVVHAQHDQVELAKAMTGNTVDLLALARAGEMQSMAIRAQLDLAATDEKAMNELTTGLSVRLPEIRDAVEAVLSEHGEMTERLTRIERHARQELLVLKDQVLLTTDVGFVVVPDDDPVLLVVIRHMNGVLEPGTVAVIRQLLDVGDTMIDVGAHIGLITLIASKKVGESGRIIAIEPVSRCAKALETMLHVNFLDSCVQVNRCAAGRTRGKSQINVGRILGHSSLLPLEESTESAMVDVKPIDEIVPAGTSVKLVKLDVEGYELECLEGMSRLLDENPNIGIVAEFGPSHLTRAGLSISEWFNAFYVRGFEGWEINEGNGQLSVPRSPRELAEVHSINFLFWRGDKRLLAGLEKNRDG
ncbi:MAG: FkbM family methyltransferase [Sphingomonas bacterium]|nr:FkbM family methyltransferase [Sphingomonas bacterium]